MQYWKDSTEVLTAVLKLFEACSKDPEIAAAFKTLDQLIVYDYSESGPACKVWMDTRDNQLSYGAGEPPALPDFTLSLSADDAHVAWSNKLNYVTALMRGKVRVEGSASGLLKLASKTKRMAELYNGVLADLGFSDKILV